MTLNTIMGVVHFIAKCMKNCTWMSRHMGCLAGPKCPHVHYKPQGGHVKAAKGELPSFLVVDVNNGLTTINILINLVLPIGLIRIWKIN